MGRHVPGICDRCGFRYNLSDLKFEYIMGKPTGLRTCPSCHDESHPQLDTRGLKTSDKQSVPDSRPQPDLEESRKLYAFDPVGTPLTSTAFVEIGRVKVVIT